jgi:3-methyladenine DNA glycosylase AlkD
MGLSEQTEALVSEIRAYCSAHANPAGCAKYARYFTEGYDGWGITDRKHPLWNEQQQIWLERYRGLGLHGFLKAGELLFAGGKYEEGALAIRFLKTYRDQLDSKALGGVAKWFTSGIANWAHTDVLCGEVITPMLVGGQIQLDTLAAWRRAKPKYQRRAVPVAMLGLLKEEKDVRPLLEFIRPLMLDRERVVHQGLGWFLREAWKKRPKPVEAFLLEWKDSAARLIFQYATEKMTPEAKARFRRAKAAKA